MIRADLDIVVRTHTAEEMAFMQSRDVGHAVMGEMELALEMTRYTLRRFGVSALEIQAVLNGLRQRLATGSGFERE
jgi:CPA2 family monovalent cation:H+ antiporter-2